MPFSLARGYFLTTCCYDATRAMVFHIKQHMRYMDHLALNRSEHRAIKASEIYGQGFKFYQADNSVWLSSATPYLFINE